MADQVFVILDVKNSPSAWVVETIKSVTGPRESVLSGFRSATGEKKTSARLQISRSASASARAPYKQVDLPPRVLIPAGEAEPDVLARFQGSIAEIFSGGPLTTEEIDKALADVRKRD